MATALMPPMPPLYSNPGMPHGDDVPDTSLTVEDMIDHHINTPLPYFDTQLDAPMSPLAPIITSTPLPTPTVTASGDTILVTDIPACLHHEIAARVQRTILRAISKETCPTPAPAAIPKKAPRPKLSQADPRYDDLRRRTIEKAKEHARELLGGSMLTEEQERLIDNVRLDATFRTHENPENPTHYDITLYYGELAPVEDTRYKVHSSHALGRGALSYPTPLSKPSPKRKRFSPPADALSA